MKREIKFRAKSIESTDWCYGIMHNDGINLFPVRVDMNTIGQFTGLYDKNQNAIYEGDILRFYHENKEYTCFIGWNDELGSWCIGFRKNDKVGLLPLGNWLCDESMMVIGNIYDNKDLLEE